MSLAVRSAPAVISPFESYVIFVCVAPVIAGFSATAPILEGEILTSPCLKVLSFAPFTPVTTPPSVKSFTSVFNSSIADCALFAVSPEDEPSLKKLLVLKLSAKNIKKQRLKLKILIVKL